MLFMIYLNSNVERKYVVIIYTLSETLMLSCKMEILREKQQQQNATLLPWWVFFDSNVDRWKNMRNCYCNRAYIYNIVYIFVFAILTIYYDQLSIQWKRKWKKRGKIADCVRRERREEKNSCAHNKQTQKL